MEPINDMSKIPRLPGDGAQADPDLSVDETVTPRKKKSVTHTIHESRKSIHEMECGEINGRIVCIRKQFLVEFREYEYNVRNYPYYLATMITTNTLVP